jgi:putative oxidoreductase
MSALFTKVRQWHDRFFALISHAQSPFLLLVRLYWGWQLAQSGWGKLHNLDKVAEFFASLNMPLPGQMAVFIACVELFGGILLALGLFSRITATVLTVNLAMAYIIADREALFSVFSDPDKFVAAAPYTFLFAALLVLIFGAGDVSMDSAVAHFLLEGGPKQARKPIAV